MMRRAIVNLAKSLVKMQGVEDYFKMSMEIAEKGYKKHLNVAPLLFYTKNHLIFEMEKRRSLLYQRIKDV